MKLKPGQAASLALSLVFLGAAPLLEAKTISAASCSQSDVQSAVNSAADGDVVTVPSGTCTWNSAVNLNKPVSLRGAGSGSSGTRVNYGGSGHALVSINPGSKTGYLEVTGFWFYGGDANNWSGNAILLSGPKGWKNVRIHNNVFDSNFPWALQIGAATYGLFDGNVFRGRTYGIKFYGDGAADWSTPLTLGSRDFFFVEDNRFEFDDFYGSTGVPAVDMYSGGRVVVRYNTFNHAFFETHDKARSGQVSANAYEVYKNTFNATSSKWKAVDLSSGTGVVWGNTFTGDWSVPIGAMDYKTFDPRTVKRCDGSDPADQNVSGQSGWRCQYQIGTQGEGSSATSFPLYVWSNTKNGAAAAIQCTDGCTHLQAGRDYFNNGTTAKPGYTPYTYPHPLANDAPRPKAPSGLQVIP